MGTPIVINHQIALALKEVAHLIGLTTLVRTRHSGIAMLMFHDVGGTGHTAREFERQLGFLRERYDVIGIEEALGALASDRPGERTKVLLTFDDGLRNHFDTVYPILTRLKLPAVFYVCPGLIEEQRWAWNFEAAARLNTLDRPARVRFAAQVGADVDDAKGLADWMKWLPSARRVELMKVIQDATPGFAPSAEERQRHDPMTWDQLLALDPSIVTVGSHTLTHPILSELEPGEVLTEIRDSRSVLEARLGRPVEHFCYPNGAMNAAVSMLVARHYRSAVGTERRLARRGDDQHHLPRIVVSPRLSGLTWRLFRLGE
jgi:peptidoglycan/xylan/chitin deacetylase (PgdA/CDA1 family)